MKSIVLILTIFMSINCYAYDHSYDVTGEDDSGHSVEGTIYSSNGERDVFGELEDENGNTYEFNGQWDGYGHISGEIDNGSSVELDTN